MLSPSDIATKPTMTQMQEVNMQVDQTLIALYWKQFLTHTTEPSNSVLYPQIGHYPFRNSAVSWLGLVVYKEINIATIHGI